MSIGLILLVAVSVLILFGVAQRVLDKLRLTDRMALLFAAALFIGGLIPDIRLGAFSVNIGGCVVPVILCVYLLVKAGTFKEKARAIFASIVTGFAVFYLSRYLANEPDTMRFDPNYMYGLAGGVVAYIFGRSRRGAFIAGVFGVLGADIAQGLMARAQGADQVIRLGSAGALDVVIIAGFTAVLLAELVGEILERIKRGNHKDETREIVDGEIVKKKER